MRYHHISITWVRFFFGQLVDISFVRLLRKMMKFATNLLKKYIKDDFDVTVNSSEAITLTNTFREMCCVEHGPHLLFNITCCSTLKC